MSKPERPMAGWSRDEPWAQVVETHAAAVFLAGDLAWEAEKAGQPRLPEGTGRAARRGQRPHPLRQRHLHRRMDRTNPPRAAAPRRRPADPRRVRDRRRVLHHSTAAGRCGGNRRRGRAPTWCSCAAPHPGSWRPSGWAPGPAEVSRRRPRPIAAKIKAFAGTITSTTVIDAEVQRHRPVPASPWTRRSTITPAPPGMSPHRPVSAPGSPPPIMPPLRSRPERFRAEAGWRPGRRRPLPLAPGLGPGITGAGRVQLASAPARGGHQAP